MTERIFSGYDYPEGMRCDDCGDLFLDGEPVRERLESFIGDVPVVVPVCQTCEEGSLKRLDKTEVDRGVDVAVKLLQYGFIAGLIVGITIGKFA